MAEQAKNDPKGDVKDTNVQGTKSSDKAPEPKKAVEKAKSEPKAKTETAPKKTAKHFRSTSAAGMTILVDGEERARFVPFFDTYKGDKVRVGYLETDDKDVIERLENDNTVESVSADEFKKETSKLELAPVYSV